ncbi:hypothetical protein DA83_01695 [Pseudomonas sp. 250J]|uniref:GrpB family protein n=1 Tax=Pseudomonas peradeniyensis TaxID=2745488 RepID=A0ABT2VC40_9PSED|nr:MULTISPECIES: hypothetical protein [Pseudomonas]KNX77505.1 hypothetical protein DA83_01695 [Pseudomonas sp. 250J]MCU7239032.1 GrpB family protein [Pseudomonas peradeniyensis]MCU7280786.1 GrpB family protein [Pseudomonas peradeniyensis]
MALTSKITTYNPEWPQRYQSDKVLLASAFGDELLATTASDFCGDAASSCLEKWSFAHGEMFQ